jgi:hypothetical protein
MGNASKGKNDSVSAHTFNYAHCSQGGKVASSSTLSHPNIMPSLSLSSSSSSLGRMVASSLTLSSSCRRCCRRHRRHRRQGDGGFIIDIVVNLTSCRRRRKGDGGFIIDIVVILPSSS